MRALIITNVFPNAAQPHSSPFNRQQFAALREFCEVEVLATVPYFPLAARLAPGSQAAVGTRVPRREYIGDQLVRHPRTLHLPKIGAALRGPLFAASLAPLLPQYRGRIDIVLGSWAYPDGCAAVALGRVLGVPTVVKLHGSDMNIVARERGPNRWLRWCLPRAAAVVAVSRALGREAETLGVSPSRIHLVENGVDPSLFHLRDRAGAREALGIAPGQPSLVYIGNLKREKGVPDLLEAYRNPAPGPNAPHLYVIGDGPLRAEVEEAASRWPRLHSVGPVPHRDVPTWIAASDAVVLPSWDEGTPNVILEALACGRRVVATEVGGIPDLLEHPSLGELVPPRSPARLRAAMWTAARANYSPQGIADRGARGSWRDSAQALHAVLARVVA